MENLFDVISPKLFSVFSRKDKRANYDLLSTIFDVFTKRERRQSIEKEELIEDLTAYIKGRKFEEFDNEEDENIENRSAHDKAMIKYRQFLKCGWLEEDRYGFTTMTSLKDNAITLLETFQNIIENRNRPLEYTGYFYIIYEALHSFEYSRSKALLEQIAKNTKELFNSLQGLSSSIKHFIEELIKRQDLTPQDVLDTLLYKYQDQVMLTVFNNLKGRDNPSKYTSEIVDTLKKLRYRELDKVVAGYLETGNNKGLTSEKYEQVEKEIKELLDDAIDRFETVDIFIRIIDDRNTKFHTAAITTLNFLLNNKRDIDGQIVQSLRALRKVSAEEDFSNIVEIYSSKQLDDKSLYTRAFNKEKVTEIVSQIPETVEDEVRDAFSEIFGQNVFSKESINAFAERCLGDKESISLSSISVNNFDDVVFLIVLQLYSQYDDMCYKVEFEDEKISVFGYQMQEFEIVRRENYDR